MPAWNIICKPEGKYLPRSAEAGEDESRSAMIVILTDGCQKQEVCRVGFIRANTKNPDVDFDTQLAREVAKARKGAELLNEMLAEAGSVTV